MSNLIEMFTIVSDPLKIAWVLWIGWGIAQIGWYRRTRQQSAGLARVPNVAAQTDPRLSSSSIRRPPPRAPLPVSTMDKQPWDQNNS